LVDERAKELGMKPEQRSLRSEVFQATLSQKYIREQTFRKIYFFAILLQYYIEYIYF